MPTPIKTGIPGAHVFKPTAQDLITVESRRKQRQEAKETHEIHEQELKEASEIHELLLKLRKQARDK